MKEAETKKININTNDNDLAIFRKAVSAFQLPWASPEALTRDADVLAVINALTVVIRHECIEKEKDQNTINNLEVQMAADQKTFEELKSRNNELELRNKENQKSAKELMKQYQQIKEEAGKLRSENEALLQQNKHQSEVLVRLQKLHFGTKSEKTDNLQDQEPEDNEDPLQEEADPERDGNNGKGGHHSGSKGRHHHKHRKKKKGKRKQDLSKLPIQEIYDFDYQQYDKEFGEGKWNILFWKEENTVEATRAVTYVKKVYKPVIEYGSGADRTLKTMGNDDPFMPRCFAGRSLVASMMCDRFMFYVPAYRMEQDPSRYGFTISRQDITNWFVKCGLDFFQPVYKYMKEKLAGYPVQQCDETI